jgi:hypothetical protein
MAIISTPRNLNTFFFKTVSYAAESEFIIIIQMAAELKD